MSARSKGGGGPAQGYIQGSGTRGKALEPIGSHFQFSTFQLRGGGSQIGDGQQAYATRPLSPKKRKTDVASVLSRYDHDFLQAIEALVAKSQEVLTRSIAARGYSEDVRNFQAAVWKRWSSDSCRVLRHMMPECCQYWQSRCSPQCKKKIAHNACAPSNLSCIERLPVNA